MGEPAPNAGYSEDVVKAIEKAKWPAKVLLCIR